MFDYTCPGCRLKYELRKRVTAKRRLCDHCGHEITAAEIDRQKDETQQRWIEESEQREREKRADEEERRSRIPTPLRPLVAYMANDSSGETGGFTVILPLIATAVSAYFGFHLWTLLFAMVLLVSGILWIFVAIYKK